MTRPPELPYLPPLPEQPTLGTRGRSYLRYEDVSQDGRLMLSSLAPAIGAVAWRTLLAAHPIYTAQRDRGVIPIMNRLVLAGTPARATVMTVLDGQAAAQLGHTADAAGEVDRIVLRLWISLAIPGRGGAEPEPAGQVFVEHVFTRPFGPPAQRKVLRLDVPGLPAVPPDRFDWRPPEAALALPEGAAPLGDARADAAPIALGLRDTDSNQHVNSLVYPRLFEEAALRRFAELGRSTAVLARHAEVGYRKPCFAGELVRVVLRAYERDGRLGAVGCFVPDARAAGAEASFPAVDRPRCCVHMVFEA